MEGRNDSHANLLDFDAGMADIRPVAELARGLTATVGASWKCSLPLSVVSDPWLGSLWRPDQVGGLDAAQAGKIACNDQFEYSNGDRARQASEAGGCDSTEHGSEFEWWRIGRA